MFDITSFPAILSSIRHHFKLCQYINYIGQSAMEWLEKHWDMVVSGIIKLFNILLLLMLG